MLMAYSGRLFFFCDYCKILRCCVWRRNEYYVESGCRARKSAMEPTSPVELACDEGHHDAATTTTIDFLGGSIGLIRIDCPSVQFSMVNDREYLALHHLVQTDGETSLEGASPLRLLDMRNRFTFSPRGARIKGWSLFEPTPQSFLTISFDTKALFSGNEVKPDLSSARSALYFRDGDLLRTMIKIERVFTGASPMDQLRLETLMMLAVLELSQVVDSRGVNLQPAIGARLTSRQLKMVRDYMQENIRRTITLSELANLVGLSRFHFARSFKNTVGQAPHQYVIALRIQAAQAFLKDRGLRMRDVARLSGFANPSEFSRTFVAHTNERPTDYRRRVLGT